MTTSLQRCLRLFRSELLAARTPVVVLPSLRKYDRRLHSQFPGPKQPECHANVPPSAILQNIDATGSREQLAHLAELPICCPGCGALSQLDLRDAAGYYDVQGRRVKDFLTQLHENTIIKDALSSATTEALSSLQEGEATLMQPTHISSPYCERCHQLQHHASGHSIVHPTITAIEAIISESSHKTNHIWHVVDAADFPMSVVMNLDQRLSLARLRTRNRRAKDTKYYRGHEVEMSFIITRADLLAPKKEQVDSLMPKLRDILRLKLQAEGRNIRLGNIYTVSAERGWWTKPLKQQIIHQQGAHWLVGKVNVGKSKLFDSIYPKGTNNDLLPKSPQHDPHAKSHTPEAFDNDANFADHFSLLPPAQPLQPYPPMPLISSLPGTTASPIRIRFNNGSGELIDLPGLHRGDLADHVLPELTKQLIMTKRVTPEKQVIKPGKALLLGGLIRIVPTSPDTIVMAHSFTPLTTHLTSASKAEVHQTGQHEAAIPSIVKPSSRLLIQSAGIYNLSDDVTRTYAGPLTRKDAGKLKPEQLPFVIYATDILIEGVGWVELVAQVRKPKPLVAQRPDTAPEHADLGLELLEESVILPPPFPQVEVFSPEGKFIAQRSTLCAYTLGGPLKKDAGVRPRRSMRSTKAQRLPLQKPRLPNS